MSYLQYYFISLNLISVWMNAKIQVSGIGNIPFKVQWMQCWNLYSFIFTKKPIAKTKKIT